MVYGGRRGGINLRWWADLDNYGDYPPLPRPPELRGQSGEPGQIVLTGTASEIEVFTVARTTNSTGTFTSASTRP